MSVKPIPPIGLSDHVADLRRQEARLIPERAQAIRKASVQSTQIADAIRGEDQPRGCPQSFSVQDAGHLCIGEFGGRFSNEVHNSGSVT